VIRDVIDLDKPRISETEILDIAIDFLFRWTATGGLPWISFK
jgi:hypothetical protein